MTELEVHQLIDENVGKDVVMCIDDSVHQGTGQARASQSGSIQE